MAHVVNFPFSLEPLDPNLVIAKPKNTVRDEVVRTVEASGNLIITRKRDGHAVLIAITGTEKEHIRIYSRGIKEITDKFPHIVDAVYEYQFRVNTLLNGEILIEQNGVDRRELFQKIASSGAEKARAIQEETGCARVVLFNVIVSGGEAVVWKPYGERLEYLQQTIGQSKNPHIHVVEVLTMPFEQAKEIALKNQWEGLVLYDKTAPSDFRLDGKTEYTPRPDGCWKWKPVLEDDFVAVGWVQSKAKAHEGAVKDLIIAQYHPETRELVPCGKVGTGLKKAERIALADNSLYPMVFEIAFEKRFVTNKLCSGRIVRRRFDKAPEECILPAA